MQWLLELERRSAASAGFITELSRLSLFRSRTRHVEAERPGELVCIDTFCVGELKGFGRLWQITACNAASSYAMTRVAAICNAAGAAAFLKQILLPALFEPGRRSQRVLTDGGSELNG